MGKSKKYMYISKLLFERRRLSSFRLRLNSQIRWTDILNSRIQAPRAWFLYVINYLRLFFTETPFERYLYFIAFKHSREETPEYLKFFSSYIDTTPAWEGTGDNSDVLHPSLVASLDYPYFYNHTYVHFLPGGYVNSKTVRMSYLGNSKFTFLNETYVDQW